MTWCVSLDGRDVRFAPQIWTFAVAATDPETGRLFTYLEGRPTGTATLETAFMLH